MEVVLGVRRGRVSIRDIFVRGSVFILFEGCSKDFFFLYLFFSSYFRYIVLTL